MPMYLGSSIVLGWVGKAENLKTGPAHNEAGFCVSLPYPESRSFGERVYEKPCVDSTALNDGLSLESLRYLFFRSQACGAERCAQRRLRRDRYCVR